MNKLPPSIIFNEQGMFYNMVSTFMASVVGMRAVYDKRNPMNFREKVVIAIEGKVHDVLKIEPYSIFLQAVSGKITTPILLNNLCGMLINTAYESVKDENDHSPEFEFFRHIRNASSHENHFNFKYGEPRRSTAWRGVIIDHSLKESQNPLQGELCFGNILATADAILLLWDIEQKLSIT